MNGLISTADSIKFIDNFSVCLEKFADEKKTFYNQNCPQAD